MIDFKKIIGEKIAKVAELDVLEVTSYIEIPPNTDLGDYAFPCFKLAKVMRKAPPVIAAELKEKIEVDELISKIEIAGGYLNFFINRLAITECVLKEIEEKGENFGANNSGEGKNIIVEKESLNNDEWKFAIRHIEKVLKNKVLFKYFDADGIWQDELLEIPFSQITTVKFGSRYVETFSKYV